MKKMRIGFIAILAAAAVCLLGVRLFSLQIVSGEKYRAQSSSRATAVISVKAPRGDIKDRNGRTLVTNREGYSLLWLKTASTDAQTNEMLAKLCTVLAEGGYSIEDSLPISFAPFEFNFADENGDGSAEDEREAWFKGKKKLTAQMSADEVISVYRKVFGIDESWDDDTARAVIGIRYNAETSGFSFSAPYTLIRDVDIDIVTKIRERRSEFADIEVTSDYFRQYEYGQLAAHTLGRIGKIYREEYAELKEKGYSMNDYVGKQGIEKICEDRLRGVNGRRVVNSEDNGELLGIKNEDAVAGNYVVLTLDADLQMAAEKALKNRIEEIAAAGEGKGAQKGADANAGAAVVLDVKTSEVLALATYPSYNPETFNELYSELNADERKPLWNRAVSGTYSPGSTFKPLTAIAALETGAVTVSEKLLCDGVYKFFKDYQPKCWIYLDYRGTHGWENVTKAIEDSCNLYFYEAGRRTGIEALDRYAALFGLGELSGIELTEESSGAMASPDYKEKVDGGTWYGGDTIQAAIGQSYSHFTPLSLANYAATIANGGTRRRPHLIRSIRRASDGTAVLTKTPETVEKISITPENLAAVQQGMYGVVDEGSASRIFADYNISVGGKTGTAQGSSKASNTALFVAYAPFEEPEIAVCVVIEHGVRGVNAAKAARDIFDEYFASDAPQAENYAAGKLLP